MGRLINIIFDSEELTPPSRQYLKLILKTFNKNGIKYKTFDNPDPLMIPKTGGLLVVYPIMPSLELAIKDMFDVGIFKPEQDLEGCFTNKLTTTAEAILKEFDPTYKNIAIINRSVRIGKPLLQELLKCDCNVTMFGKHSINLMNQDVIITATGDENFRIYPQGKLMIDLSNDVLPVESETRVISHVDTINILLERVKNYD